jgi:D-serine deaminase-like pyridoxal phosphate-dependent protein
MTERMAMRAADEATPALMVDLRTLDRNISGMAEFARRAGVQLRPHAKTHKTAEGARRQIDAGARGLCVATVGEAESFADAGFSDLFIAYPLFADQARARRLAALAERTRLRVGVDSPEGATALGRAASSSPFQVLVEIDCGHHRSGVIPAAAAAVADAASRAGLEVIGVFTFPGHGYGPSMPARAARDEAAALEEATTRLEAAGHAVAVRSGGSTPTARHAVSDVVTELRPGVYIFNDAQQVALGTCPPQDVALSARSTVVSAPVPGRIVVDAGSKVLGADRPAWVPGHGLLRDVAEATITSLSEHHGVVAVAAGRPAPRVGDIVQVIPNHVCTAVNLVDELIVTSCGAVVDRWRVRARGRNA